VVAATTQARCARSLDLVAPHGLSVVSAGELGLPEPERTATFAATPSWKALAATARRRLPALSDDLGLSGGVGGAPASIRRAGPSGPLDLPSPCAELPTGFEA
jgi:XTP/dITP diphosphohydrolase